jgi:hypothetical protein
MMRSRWRWLFGASCCALVVLGLSARVIAQQTHSSRSAKALSRAWRTPQPGFKAMPLHLAREVRARARREAFLRSARAVRERRVSRSRYGRLSSAKAIRLAERLFPSVVSDSPWVGLRLPAGSRLVRYVGSDEAVLRSRTGHGSLVLSSGSLVGRTAGGRRAPVNLSLRRWGGGFVPRSAAIALRFPELASGAVRFGAGSDRFGVSLVGASSQPAIVEHGHLAFGNAYRATDAFVQALPSGTGGMELSYQLRSPSSPRTLGLLFRLPSGETLALAGAAKGRGLMAVIERGKRIVAVVTPAVAKDAQGQPVRVSYSVEGDELALHSRRAGRSRGPCSSIRSWRRSVRRRAPRTGSLRRSERQHARHLIP